MPSSKKEWTVAGLMSGTSLDGLDMAICRFRKNGNKWSYKIVEATTVSYSSTMKNKLALLMSVNAQEFASMDASFGKFSGEQLKKFLSQKKLRVDLIASHGHTIFHQPEKGFTTQIGNGAYIAAAARVPVVSDFRTMDVALGGQGAPLVPIGDKLLFSEYDYCLNLGGIANISFDSNKKRIAGDICPVNILLNKLAEEKGFGFDKDGKMAAKGIVNQVLLKKLNNLSFYKKKFPKSLGREWIDKDVFPILTNSVLSTEDKLATVCEHIAFQIIAAMPSEKGTKLLVTGGGALNKYLVSRIAKHAGNSTKIIVPDTLTISFKEALIFAFLGLKRILGEPNALSNVTGASKDSVGGALYGEVNFKL
ncbi:MAG TPA: anhydro-N-acetylmuramic acid kinase [Cytophagaceae bacterium]|jgi:anhydro-N-acetylmuramic acid kinase|nr:anhydro-N-acetylmuramic acid kinase [Cytophagaceae bacterium]